MAACGSIQHIFEKPFPENPTFLESLSQQWSQIKSNPSSTMKQDHSSSFTEIFGELHFKENSPLQTPAEKGFFSNNYSSARSHKNCTEGLGFESSDEVEDILAMDTNTPTIITHDTPDCIVKNEWRRLEVVSIDNGEREIDSGESDRKSPGRKPRAVVGGGGGKGFPPPISCLSKTGKPRVCFESYREDGRFVLKEIRVQTREFLHACREDGRLKLHFVQPSFDEEIVEDGDIQEDEEEDGDDDDCDGI